MREPNDKNAEKFKISWVIYHSLPKKLYFFITLTAVYID